MAKIVKLTPKIDKDEKIRLEQLKRALELQKIIDKQLKR